MAPYEAIHKQVSTPTNDTSSLFTCFYSPRYKNTKKPVSVTIWKHGDTWELEFTCSKECIAYDHIAEDQRKQNDNTNNSTVHKLASDEFNLTTTHLVIPYSDDEVKIRLVALLSACSLLQLMLSMLRTISILAIWRLYLISAATSMNQSGCCKQLDTDSNRLPSNIWQRLLCNLTVNTHSKYGQLVSMRTLPTKSQNSGGLRKNLFHEQRVTPLPLPDSGLTRHCPMSGTVEQLNRTTYNAKDNKLSAITSSTDSKRDKPTIMTYYAVPVIRALQECGSEINPTSLIRSVQPGGIATCTSFILAQYGSSYDSGPSPSIKHRVFVYTNTSTRPSYTLDVPGRFAGCNKPSPRSCSDNGNPDRNTTNPNTSNSGKSSRDRVATRRALRPRNTLSQPAGRSYNSDDEDEEDDEKRRRQKRKILSQCEAMSLATIAKSIDQELERNTSQLPEQHHLQHHDQSLLMHGFSKLWNSMANMTLFGAHNQSAAALTAENRNTTLNYLNISINGGLTGEINPIAIPEKILELTPIKSRPEEENTLDVPTVLLTTPDSDKIISEESASDDDKQAIVVPTILLTPTHEGDRIPEEPGGDGAFYTGRGNPEITPRRCVVRGDISNRSPSCHLSVTPKPRVRSRSESLTRPYQIPPADIIKRRLRRKLHNSAMKEDTPLSRKRATSESDLTHQLTGPISPFRCVHAKDAGRHEWGQNPTNAMELNHNLIDTDDTKGLINNAVAKLLTNSKPSDTACTSPLNRSTTVVWEPEDIERYHRGESSITEDNCLLHLR